MTGLFFDWLYIDAPKTYVKNGKAFLLALYNYFSLPLLLATLGAPWRKDSMDLSRVPLRLWFQIIVNNATSRFIGFIVRFSVILLGSIVLILVALGWMLFIVVWLLLPILLAGSFIYGFVFIAKGGG